MHCVDTLKNTLAYVLNMVLMLVLVP